MNIEPGASVSTHGRHGAGQPAIAGVVQRVERGEVLIRTIEGKSRRRSINHVRRVD